MTVDAESEQVTNGIINWPVRTGIFLVVVSWFIYLLYDNILGVYNRHTTLPLAQEDIPASIGIGFAVAASAAAILTLMFFLVKRDLTKPETTMAIRIILFLEALYFILGFLPAVWVEGIPGSFHFSISKLFEVGIPSLVDAVAIPIVLSLLILSLNPNKPANRPIKWGLIAGTVYLFAFWVSNAGNWIGEVITKGLGYITDYPVNMLSFILTTVGLFLLTAYIANLTWKTTKLGQLYSVSLRKIGIILTALGLYLTFILLLWFIFGSVGGWGSWYAWFLGHGYLDLWGLTLPFVGLPLLFFPNAYDRANTSLSSQNTIGPLKRSQLNLLLYVTEALGILFYAILSAAYYIVIPSTKVLIGEPIFKVPITILGLIYLIDVVTIAVSSFLIREGCKFNGLNRKLKS